MVRIFLKLLAVSGLIANATVLGADQRPLSFNRDVRPILSDKCFFCHGPDDKHRAADLRLDDSEAALESAIVAGNANESELISRLLDSDPDIQMPPPETGKQVSEDEVEVLRRWIDQGAAYEPYWAYVPPVHVVVPAPVGQPEGIQAEAGPIDRMVRSTLDQQHGQDQALPPSPRASERDQVRRLYLDLTGLPPSYEQIQSFVADQSPVAYEQLVDRLLASPGFGERLAEYWLDLVRFADTVGYHGDQVHNIAPYRDYIVDSLNDGLPLDQFSPRAIGGRFGGWGHNRATDCQRVQPAVANHT